MPPWLQITLALLEAAPKMIETIKLIDGAMQGSHKGALKKDVVMAAFAHAPVAVREAAGAFVDRSVAALKVAGDLPTHPPAPGSIVSALGQLMGKIPLTNLRD
jgi:hypothetical protein